jgi:hypothetical protein
MFPAEAWRCTFGVGCAPFGSMPAAAASVASGHHHQCMYHQLELADSPQQGHIFMGHTCLLKPSAVAGLMWFSGLAAVFIDCRTIIAFG